MACMVTLPLDEPFTENFHRATWMFEKPLRYDTINGFKMTS